MATKHHRNDRGERRTENGDWKGQAVKHMTCKGQVSILYTIYTILPNNRSTKLH